MTTEQLSKTADAVAGSEVTRRGLVRSLGECAMAGAMLASIGGVANAADVGNNSQKADLPSYEAIRNLLATYSFLLDSADYPKWGALFGTDGTIELDGAVWARGADGVAKKMTEQMTSSVKPIRGFKGDYMYRHVTTNIHIVVDEAAGTASARAYFFVLHVDKGVPPYVRGGGRYDDKFARVDGVWRFVAKRIAFDWSDAA